MTFCRNITARVVSVLLFLQFTANVNACGVETLEPIFVVADSPDPPFLEFTRGNIGILKPSFGRKTLTIAYRYLNGGSFNGEEQQQLIEALKGQSPEPNDDVALKAWIEARKTVAKNEEELPEIYRESRYGSYDFFPNCTANAFEVAVQTLRDRVSRFGAEDPNVQEWLKGQDTVFRNCAQNGLLPTPVGAERPVWLQKDRDYQIAAANFYSLNFDDARERFEQISHDAESDWRETADYLVGRTLVRQASFEHEEGERNRRHEKAEIYLTNLSARANKFHNAANKLLALLKFRMRPEERALELSQVLAGQSGNDNLRQDLIDYVWLLDKFDQQIQKAEEGRKKSLEPPDPDAEQKPRQLDDDYEAVRRGELIQIWFAPKNPDGQPDYVAGKQFRFTPETSEAEVLQAIEAAYGRKLTAEETKTASQSHTDALFWRKWQMSPNRQWQLPSEYDGCEYHCNDIPLNLLPAFLRSDELSDWIFTFQSSDPEAFSHALNRWQQSQSPAWFVAALSKSSNTSPSIARLLAHSEKIHADLPIYPTVLYHRIRLYSERGNKEEARRLLDQLIATQLQSLPVSAQNEFVQMRMEVAQSFTEFLKFSARKPVAYYQYGTLGTLEHILGVEQEILEDDQSTKEYVDKLMAWNDRLVFDEQTSELLNWHFPLTNLVDAAHDPAIPDYLRQRILLTAWTRAVLLKNDQISRAAAKEIFETNPAAAPLFQLYLNSKTASEAEAAATYILLKSPGLSPYLTYGVPEVRTTEEMEYYFETSWWCPLSETDYDDQGNAVPKRVAAPTFLAPQALAIAKKERAALIALGNAKALLGRRVLQWAERRPQDPLLPEALFIAVRANETYKYGCNGWEHEDELHGKLTDLLVNRFPNNAWSAKLSEQNR